MNTYSSTNIKADDYIPVAKVEQWRSSFLLALIMLGMSILALWAVYLHLINNDFLQARGEARYSRLLPIAAPRGKIYDRNMVVLASNVPAHAVWVIPEDVLMTPVQEANLAKLLDMSIADVRKKVSQDEKRFVYLRRQVSQDAADKITEMKIPGVHLQKEVKRDYPQGEMFANLTGYTDIEGKGKDAIEWAYDKTIQGKDGSRRVIRDRIGNVIEDEGVVEASTSGQDVVLSLDARVQYIVYNALRDVVDTKHAKSASAMVVDTQTGEVLAFSNYPSFDPNNRKNVTPDQLRNRGLTDVFEPGSTLKPFTVALALEQGIVTPQTTIDAQGGHLQIGDANISDSHPNGILTVEQVIQKSSNVGTSKIALKLKPVDMWNTFNSLGFGQSYKVGFPSVAAGILRPYKNWQPIEQATMSYGHGIAMSLLQLTHAYTVFARDGDIVPLTFTKAKNADTVSGVRVYSAKTTLEMRKMMEMATEKGGTAQKAQVRGYRVAGKTGTAYKVEGNGYNKNKYVASFAGLAPASKPRIVVTVVVDEPPESLHFGGDIAAPAFSQIVSETLRTLSVMPDAPYKTDISTDDTTEKSF